MGHLVSTQPKTKIGLFGWNGAGKTTLLYKMVLGKTIESTPTMGFNVETFEFEDTKFVAWDLGGRGKIRPLHRHYYPGLEGVIYIVDAVDQSEVMQDAIDEFTKMVNEPELRDSVFVLLGNKQDMPDALSMEELANRFNVKDVKQPLYVRGVSATGGDGLREVFEWLANQLKKPQQSKWHQLSATVSKYTSFLRCTSPQEQIVE